ncbi:MAG: hypothetical protein WDW36_009401 [Sanguina aurantia]
MDDSPEALHALHWAIDNLVLGRDTAALHIIASAFPDPVVPCFSKTILRLFEDPTLAHVGPVGTGSQRCGTHGHHERRTMDEDAWSSMSKTALSDAEGGGSVEARNCHCALQLALKCGVDPARVTSVVLPAPSGGQHIGASITEYAKEHSIGVVAVGCRGMGVVRQALMSVAGLGSVSAYLSHHLSAGCSLVVVTHHQPAELAQPELNTR